MGGAVSGLGGSLQQNLLLNNLINGGGSGGGSAIGSENRPQGVSIAPHLSLRVCLLPDSAASFVCKDEIPVARRPKTRPQIGATWDAIRSSSPS